MFGGPKYTVSPVYEGLLKEEMDAAAERHPEVPYEPQLIDATFALLQTRAATPLVIPALNRDGDILSDLVLPLFGSIAGSESRARRVRRRLRAQAVDGRGRARHRAVAPGQERREPDGDDPRRRSAARHGDDAGAGGVAGDARGCLEAVAAGVRTADLGGHAGTTEFTDEVIRRTRAKLEVWATL